MWASKTNYAKLYSADYFGKSDGAASYNGSDFERVFIEFCKAHAIKALVDVGTGSGKLKQTATAAGMTVFSCDFDPVEKEAFHFDLSSDDLSKAEGLRDRIDNLIGSSDYVATCLDVMEHIDIEDVGNALFNLREVVRDFAIVSISTRPSSRGNKYHSTILPISTWQHLFELAGFDIVDASFCSEGRRVMPLTSHDSSLKIIAHWAQADIFEDRLHGEPTYFLVRRTRRALNTQAVLAQMEIVLDIAYRRQKRAGFDAGRMEAIAFNISHFQDFFNIRPILDVIPRGQCSVLLRNGMLLEDEEQIVMGFFERCGVPILRYREVQDVDWRVLNVKTLISAAESSAAINHALSAQLVEAANLHGIHTILLQHGIWIEPMADRLITFASNTILTWGQEQQRFFVHGLHAVAGVEQRYGAIEGSLFRPAGSPKFHDSLLDPNPDVLKWRLGVDVTSFDDAVLVGTNLKWGAHCGTMPEVLDGIERMIAANPDRLFVIKPHPSERHSDYSQLKLRNTLVLDDVLTGCVDLPISRLLGGISTVVTSLSTLLLDGAVLGKRCIQYETGNRFDYEGCQAFAPSDLHLAVQNPAASSLKAVEFSAHYNDAGNDAFYETLATCVASPPPNSASAKRYTDLKSAEGVWLQLRDLRPHAEVLEAKVEVLEAEVEVLEAKVEALSTAYLAELHEEQNRHVSLLQTAYLSQQKSENSLAHMGQQVTRLTAELDAKSNSLASLRASTSWRMTSPYRWTGHQVLRARFIAKAVPRLAKSRGGYLNLLTSAARILRRSGIRGAIASWRMSNMLPTEEGSRREGGSPTAEYARWLQTYAHLTDDHRRRISFEIGSWDAQPLISIVMPVYNPDILWLDEAIVSVVEQLYPHWELCIADDCSTKKGVREFLKQKAATDSRIKLTLRGDNGHISEASNSALELATGDWMALLDQDDLLSEDALYYVAKTINEHPKCQLVYTDEDKIEDGQRCDPYFKPDWNPDLLRSQNVICHLGVYRLDRVRSLGGFRKGYEGSQDHDLVLRFTEGLTTAQIRHVPRVLYHWRSHAESTAQAGSNKNYASVAGRKALTDHLDRLGLRGEVHVLPTGMYRVKYTLPEILPKVSLIIPTRNGFELISQCVDSILTKTTYANYEILVIDNNSDDPRALDYFQRVEKDPRVRIIHDGQPFNYSAINNRAVELADGEFVALINNDIEVITPEWLDEMISIALQPDVGAIGARLWYPDDRLQHGGVIIGIGGVAGHSHKLLPKGRHGYFSRAELLQTVSAVTAACLVIRKSTFELVGGLDEENLKVAFNDVDFCLKVREAGFRNVWTPFAELYHHESASRGHEDTPEKQERFRSEVMFMIEKWKDHLISDPAYNPNLTLDHEDFSLAWPPRNSDDPTLAS